MHRDGWEGSRAGTRVSLRWLVFERDPVQASPRSIGFGRGRHDRRNILVVNKTALVSGGAVLTTHGLEKPSPSRCATWRSPDRMLPLAHQAARSARTCRQEARAAEGDVSGGPVALREPGLSDWATRDSLFGSAMLI
jgi:hypothetical protein